VHDCFLDKPLLQALIAGLLVEVDLRLDWIFALYHRLLYVILRELREGLGERVE